MQELQADKLHPIELSRLPVKPLISVLIANYNYAKYIGETLESVLLQTYPHFEVIICDDGSTDNSCEVIEAYIQKDPRLKLVLKQNGGVASALNAAYRESSGQIVCLLDADDLWMPNKLQTVLEEFQSDPKCGFVIHNVIQIDGKGKSIKPTPMYRRLASGWMGPFALENGGFVYNIPPASALSIQRKVADVLFPINEVFVRNADSLVFRLAPFLTVIRSVPEVLSMFRLHGANTTSFLAVKPKHLEQQLELGERIHTEQEHFLTNVHGAETARDLTALNSSLEYLHYRYLLTRLRGMSKHEKGESHQQLIAHPQFEQLGRERWLLRQGKYLPDSLFAPLFRLVYWPNPIKRLVKLLIDE